MIRGDIKAHVCEIAVHIKESTSQKINPYPSFPVSTGGIKGTLKLIFGMLVIGIV